MKKQFLSLLLAISMCTLLTIPAIAVENDAVFGKGVDQTSATSRLESQLVIQVEEGKATFSPEVNELLDSVSQNIEQVVYQVNAGKDTFTIGYAPGLSDFNIDDMREGIRSMVNSINQDITTDSDLEGNHEFKAQDLELTQVFFDATQEEQNQIKKKFNSITEETITPNDIIIKKISERKSDILSTNSTSITGSYHTKNENVGMGTFKWYNQSTGKFSVCDNTLTEPHAGDGNARYSLAGYKWYPTTVKTWFKTEAESGKNRVTLQYVYSPTQLSYLQKDSNEALEMSVAFYNYTNASAASQRGYSYMQQQQITWSTTQPKAYLDTSFGDQSGETDFCVGVYDATALKADTAYRWTITSKAGTKHNYPNDGRFRIVAQRSYRFTTAVGGSFNVFAEEHERILKLGLTSTQNWVPTLTGWSLGATSQTPWTFNAVNDSVRG